MNNTLWRKSVAWSVLLLAVSAPAAGMGGPNDSIVSGKNLKEVVVTGFGAERNLLAPEMGRVSLNEKMITDLPVLFGEPDLVKTLQTLPGVSQGVEGFSGLFVRGGDNDQNLFLYQGLPLYHVSHLGGIFSSFNVATLSRVDFYKSAFPAIYGGRISSITDVKMKSSDMEAYHGRFNIGLLSANIYFTGPIVKERTAFTVAMRRSWIDLLGVPALAVVNAIDKKNGKKHIVGYSFTDFNARLDHRLGSRATATILGYYGNDRLKMGLREFENTSEGYYVGSDGTVVKDQNDPGNRFFDENSNRMSWGNWGVLGGIDYNLSKGYVNASVYYSEYSSVYRQEWEYQSDLDDPDTYACNKSRTENSIQDVGVNVAYSSELSKLYKLRAGMGYVFHDYLPEGIRNHSVYKGGLTDDENEWLHVHANEGFAYIDNTLSLGSVAAMNVSLRGVIYDVEGHTYKSLQPRVSLRCSVSKNYSLKASYARMEQYVQQVSSNYIDLPTDLWHPVTQHFKPLRSDQYSLGLYGTLPHHMYFSVEGWYKDMSNLIEYKEGVSALNSGLNWEDKIVAGKGWAYGVDVSLTKEAGAVTFTAGYGLLWNWRKFDELNQGLKFPAKFDNRHKINLNASYKLNEKIDFNAGWTFMTGNRLTLSLYNYDVPGDLFPDAPHVGVPGYSQYDGLNYYSMRNNVRLPAYHRLDLGMNINKKCKNGNKGVWNISLYNAYCHMNAMTITKDNDNNLLMHPGRVGWHRAFKTFSLIPVIPSVSYTYIF